MIDVAEALSEIVAPAVRSVFRDGEVSAVDVRSEGESIVLTLTVVPEDFVDRIVQAGFDHLGVEEWRERLRSNLADWFSESRLGWGQDRGV